MDDKRKRGKPDRDLISLEEKYEVSGWCRSLGCNATELREAVEAVGPSARKVRAYLFEKHGPAE